MSSNVLTCSAWPLLSIKASSSPSKTALAPKSVVLPGPTSSRALSLVVRADAEEGRMSKEISNIDHVMRKDISHLDPLLHFNLNKSVAMIDTSPYMRTPWNTIEDENEIRMWFDMPGLTVEGIDVTVVNNLLIIKGAESIDTFGRKIHGPFDFKLQLPFNCAKEYTQAGLKNGVLHISVPKITKPEHMKLINVPVRAL